MTSVNDILNSVCFSSTHFSQSAKGFQNFEMMYFIGGQLPDRNFCRGRYCYHKE